MGVPLLGAALVLGSFAADVFGPPWWRLYWIGAALWLLRGATVMWIRLRLPRVSAGVLLGAVLFGMFALTNGRIEAGEAVARLHLWTLPVGMLLLFAFEDRWSPVKLRSFRGWVNRASVWNRLTFSHVPDVRCQKDA